MAISPRERRCKARTKAGKPCKAAPTAGGMCFFHGNPNKAVELGRRGGRGKRFSCSENPDPKLDTVLDVHDVAAWLVKGVLTGQVQPRVAAVLAQLLGVQLRAIGMKTNELLAQLEKGGADREAVGASQENLKLQAPPPATPTTEEDGDRDDADTVEPRGGGEEDE